MTKYGTKILQVVNESELHPTAEQVFFEVRKTYPSVAMATVYNNLNSLYAARKIRKISIEGQNDRYDNNTKHDHLVCRACGRVFDLKFHDLSEELARETGIKEDSYELIVYHTCEECSRRG